MTRVRPVVLALRTDAHAGAVETVPSRRADVDKSTPSAPAAGFFKFPPRVELQRPAKLPAEKIAAFRAFVHSISAGQGVVARSAALLL